jgi:hypothetical protein
MAASAEDSNLWKAYNDTLKGAKYIDMTHTITPKMPVWIGFGTPTFSQSKAGVDVLPFAKRDETFTYAKQGL